MTTEYAFANTPPLLLGAGEEAEEVQAEGLKMGEQVREREGEREREREGGREGERERDGERKRGSRRHGDAGEPGGLGLDGDGRQVRHTEGAVVARETDTVFLELRAEQLLELLFIRALSLLVGLFIRAQRPARRAAGLGFRV